MYTKSQKKWTSTTILKKNYYVRGIAPSKFSIFYKVIATETVLCYGRNRYIDNRMR